MIYFIFHQELTFFLFFYVILTIFKFLDSPMRISTNPWFLSLFVSASLSLSKNFPFTCESMDVLSLLYSCGPMNKYFLWICIRNWTLRKTLKSWIKALKEYFSIDPKHVMSIYHNHKKYQVVWLATRTFILCLILIITQTIG